MVATRLTALSGVDLVEDLRNQSAKSLYIGDPSFSSASATYIALTNAYRDAKDIDAAREAVIDLRNFDILIAVLDYAKNAGTGLRVKASFGEDDDRTKLNMQETRIDHASFDSQVRYELLEHVFTASYRGYLEIRRQSRYVKLSVKSDGTPDANDKVAIALFGVIENK